MNIENKNNINCYYCKTPTNELSANPSDWPLCFCHEDEPGIVKSHHVKCVTERLKELEKKDIIIKNLEERVKKYMAKYPNGGPYCGI